MISDKEIEAKAAEFQLRPLEVQQLYLMGKKGDIVSPLANERTPYDTRRGMDATDLTFLECVSGRHHVKC